MFSKCSHFAERSCRPNARQGTNRQGRRPAGRPNRWNAVSGSSIAAIRITRSSFVIPTTRPARMARIPSRMWSAPMCATVSISLYQREFMRDDLAFELVHVYRPW